MKTINSKLEIITPPKAAEYLKSNNQNRKPREYKVLDMADEILAGRWMVTHQGIAFDEAGNLIDGQHRLLAIIRANTACEMMVTRGVPSKNGELFAMDVIDTGIHRTTADQLGLMHGIENPRLCAASCRFIALACATERHVQNLTVGQANGILAIYYDGMKEIIQSASGNKLLLVGPIIAALTFGCAVDRTLALEFTKSLASGEELKSGDPVLALRETLIRGVGNYTSESRRSAFLSTATAFFKALQGQQVKFAKAGKEGIAFLLAKQRANVARVQAVFAAKN